MARRPCRATRPAGPRAVLLAFALAALHGAVVRAEEPAETDLAAADRPAFEAHVALRAYAVYPKFRFRDGEPGAPGSSFRTQRIGLDAWRPAPGGEVGAWILSRAWLGLEGWTFTGRGESTSTRPMTYGGLTLPEGGRVRTHYALTHVASRLLLRVDLFEGLVFADVGAQVEHLDFRANVTGAGRTKLRAVWPSPRLHVGVRPLPWLELEGRFGGFLLGFPLGSTKVTESLEVGGLVRLRLPAGAFVEVGGHLLHGHLEDDPGDVDEDALHLRHRALFGALGVAF